MESAEAKCMDTDMEWNGEAMSCHLQKVILLMSIAYLI
jgi:hypothetical protein